MSTGPARSTTTTKRPISGPPSARPSISRSNSSSLSTTGAAKPATLRSSVSSKPVPPARKPTATNRTSPAPSSSRTDSPAPVPEGSPQINGVAVNAETFDTAKEELHAQIQDLDGTISSLTKENNNIQTALSQAETRLHELYADQARWEEELAKRLQLTDNLRAQVREYEKERREVTKRYNDQTTAFDAERQAFYDNEQHLKSRIQALSQARKEDHPARKTRHQVDDDAKSVISEAEYPPPASPGPFDGLKTPRVIRRGGSSETSNSRDGSETDENEPAEMTALKLELSTLATSHASLQSSMQLLQAQLLDLQRVNASLQDENEGWGVLVQQRTLAGTFDISGLGPTRKDTVESPSNAGAEDDVSVNSMRSGRSGGRGTLDRVPELDELAYEASQHDKETELDPELDPDASARQTRSPAPELDPSVIGEEKAASSRSRRRGTANGASSPTGESLANLPITGPGLDLAAELGRAENNGGFLLSEPPKPAHKKSRQHEEKAEAGTKSEVEALRAEVKALKDANKALTLYSSKIIDRIITMEGFENVLAVDFQATPPTPGPTSGVGKFISAITGGGSGSNKSGARPTSFLFGGKATAPPPTAQERLTTFETFRLDKSKPAQSQPPAPAPEPTKADSKRSRRSMSFDFRGLFGTSASQTEADKRAHDPSLKPLTLRPGSTSLNPNALPANLGAKKLETTEDDDDRKERERLRATMRLMGIEPALPAAPPVTHSHSEPLPPQTYSEPPKTPLPSFSTGGKVVSVGAPPPSVPPTPSKWKFFRRNTESGSGSSTPPTSLTAEALEQAEAESHIAELDAREKVMKDEIAKGSGSGFTEVSSLRGGNGGTRRSLGDEWRSRRSSVSLASLGGTEGFKVKSPQGPDSDAGSISQASLLFNAEDVHDD